MKNLNPLRMRQRSADALLLPEGIQDISQYNHMVKQFLEDSYTYLGFSQEVIQEVSQSISVDSPVNIKQEAANS